MKKTIVYFSVLLVLANIPFYKVYSQAKDDLKGSISISGAFALYPFLYPPQTKIGPKQAKTDSRAQATVIPNPLQSK